MKLKSKNHRQLIEATDAKFFRHNEDATVTFVNEQFLLIVRFMTHKQTRWMHLHKHNKRSREVFMLFPR